MLPVLASGRVSQDEAADSGVLAEQGAGNLGGVAHKQA